MALATKEQERKALEKIKEIVAELGGDSYVGTALKGCFEIAEQNIENDWGCSLRDDIDDLLKVCDQRLKEIIELKREIDTLKSMHASACDRATELSERVRRAEDEANNERKDLTITIKNDERTTGFKSIKLCRNNLFDFIVIEQRDGWTDSYRLNEIKSLTIE